ncbi:MAG: hypothetical protein WA876_13245 [Candidatus Acidiferrales bacterium]
MNKRITLLLAILSLASVAVADRKCPLSDAQLAEITTRGRMLAEYGRAGRHSTDALLATNPDQQGTPLYVARKTPAGWIVAFGRLNDARNKFLIAYEATEGADLQQFQVKRLDPPQEDTGFFLFVARAIVTALGDFPRQNRPYNTLVLPLDSGQMYVYVVPSQTTSGIYPLGGDVRYLISPDGNTIAEKRLLHKTILERKMNAASPGSKTVGGFHTHVLSDVPEDTDVLFVLSEQPPLPEYIGTKSHIYVVAASGSISCVK